MANKSFSDIVYMVVKACNENSFGDTKDIRDSVLACATQIYIAQMKSGDNVVPVSENPTEQGG